jgi:hypothetical protein
VSRPVFVAFEADGIKFADMGFLDEFDNKKTLEVYSLGTPVFRLSFDEYVCFDFGCIKKQEFVHKYIADGICGGLLDDVLARRPLAIDAIVRQDVTDGFVQTAKVDGKYEITYTVKNKSVEFVEKLHGFRFFIRFVDGG